jgi:hypothetical protein
MQVIKAIETVYKGYRFRSRLEARWAVFFDALGIEWEYEAEGYELSDGSKYLPDFWLPTFNGGMYVEVKPVGGDFSKARKFSEDSTSKQEKTILLAEGTPGERAYEYSTIEISMSGEYQGIQWYVGVPCADQAWGENRMFAEPGYQSADNSIPEMYRDCLGPDYLGAVVKARSARFEHGEVPR